MSTPAQRKIATAPVELPPFSRHRVRHWPAGPSLDLFVADKLMGGLVPYPSRDDIGIGPGYYVNDNGRCRFFAGGLLTDFCPSTNFSDAQDVLPGAPYDIDATVPDIGIEFTFHIDGKTYSASSETAQLARCRAALLTICTREQ